MIHTHLALTQVEDSYKEEFRTSTHPIRHVHTTFDVVYGRVNLNEYDGTFRTKTKYVYATDDRTDDGRKTCCVAMCGDAYTY